MVMIVFQCLLMKASASLARGRLDPKVAALMRHAKREAVDLPAGGGARQVMLIGAPDFPKRVAIALHPVPGIAVRQDSRRVRLENDLMICAQMQACLAALEVAGPGTDQIVGGNVGRRLSGQ